MKIHMDVIIEGENQKINSLLEVLKQINDDVWKFNKEKCEDLPLPSAGDLFSFDCKTTKNHAAASLWIFRNKPEKVEISTIVPDEVGQLSYDEYNIIAKEFFENYIKERLDEYNLKAKLSPDDVKVEHLVSKETAAKLHLFSVAANKSTGSSHPLDQGRWFDFITSVHLNEEKLDPHTLARLLNEEEKWSDKMAHELAIEYEIALELLKYYDRKI